MQALIDAIKAKISGSTFEADVNGRIYLDEADDMTLPYVVFFIVSAVPEKTFTEIFSDVLVQFSLFSAKTAGVAEIANIYNDLKTLLDECALTISDSTLVWMRENSLTTMIEPDTAPDGSSGIRHWAVDMELKSSLQ